MDLGIKNKLALVTASSDGMGRNIAHTLAAEGKIGAAVDYGLRLWDIAATQVLVEEAGGRFACVYRSRDADGDLYGIIAGKPSLVRWLEGIFR
jgi:fructose-1,6-bisphosphatase/inositol monophosphatase family enzyme